MKTTMYQLICVRSFESIWTGPQKAGDVVWVRTLDAARHLIEQGICKWPAPETEKKPIGPAFTKPAEPAEKKSSAAPMAGPSTASASSSEPGPQKLSSASAAALVPAQRL